jgi:hypothetical protein
MKWIKVTDKLPKDEQIVLTYNPITQVNQSVFKNNKFVLLCWGNHSGKWFPDIQYWMSLPEPPEGYE